MDQVRRLENVPPIGVDAMGAAADAAQDPTILRLENLDTDLRPPAEAVAATKQSADRDKDNSYLPFLGRLELREAVTAHLKKLSGQVYHPRQECLVTAGGLNGCLVALNALINPGDEVIVTDPTYVGLLNRIRIAGGRPVQVPYNLVDDQWRLDLDELKAAVSPKTKAFLVMSPSMPSGATLNRSEWQVICDLCHKIGAWLVYNAAMERILYDQTEYLHPASFAGMRDRTITIGSVSKEFRMIGWRVGWVVGPAPIMRDVGLVSISDVVVPVGLAQPAAKAALEADEADLLKAVKTWEDRRNLIMDELAGLPLRSAAGGWSMLLDAGELGMSGLQASKRLFDIGRIAATPMVNWGRRHGEQYVRFVFSNEPVERLRGIGERVRRSLT